MLASSLTPVGSAADVFAYFAPSTGLNYRRARSQLWVRNNPSEKWVRLLAPSAAPGITACTVAENAGAGREMALNDGSWPNATGQLPAAA